MSCYGYPKETTPNIDSLASEGAVFLDNVSPAIWTLPSTASIMTGLHAHSHGACAHNDLEVHGLPTLASMLTPLNYNSVAFYANAYCESSKDGFRETHRNHLRGESMGQGCFDLSRGRVERAIEWMKYNYLRHPDDSRQPFLMFIQVMDPHMPFYPPAEFRERFVLEDATEEEIENRRQSEIHVHGGALRPTQRQYDVLKSFCDAETAAADSHVGVLADFMREAGVLDETAFIVTSDHGDMFGEKKEETFDHFSHHLCLYEPLIQVPLVVRYPAAFPAGARVTHSTQTHDIMPTLAELIGFEAPMAQGFSLLPALDDKPARAFTLTEYMKSTHVAARVLDRINPKQDVRVYLRWLKAWRKDGWKYIWTSDRHDELYHLADDPEEESNLIASMPEKADAMRIEMEDYLTTLPYALRGDKVATGRCDPKVVERLRALEFFQEIQ